MRAFLAQSAVKPTEKPRGNDSNTPSPNLSGESQTSGDAQDVREGNGSGSRIGLGISNGGENSRASAGASLSPNQERTNGAATGHNTRNGRGTGVTTELTRRQLGPLQLKSRSQSPAVKQSSGTPNSSVKRAGDVLEAGKRKRSRDSGIDPPVALTRDSQTDQPVASTSTSASAPTKTPAKTPSAKRPATAQSGGSTRRSSRKDRTPRQVLAFEEDRRIEKEKERARNALVLGGDTGEGNGEDGGGPGDGDGRKEGGEGDGTGQDAMSPAGGKGKGKEKPPPRKSVGRRSSSRLAVRNRDETPMGLLKALSRTDDLPPPTPASPLATDPPEADSRRTSVISRPSLSGVLEEETEEESLAASRSNPNASTAGITVPDDDTASQASAATSSSLSRVRAQVAAFEALSKGDPAPGTFESALKGRLSTASVLTDPGSEFGRDAASNLSVNVEEEGGRRTGGRDSEVFMDTRLRTSADVSTAESRLSIATVAALDESVIANETPDVSLMAVDDVGRPSIGNADQYHFEHSFRTTEPAESQPQPNVQASMSRSADMDLVNSSDSTPQYSSGSGGAPPLGPSRTETVSNLNADDPTVDQGALADRSGSGSAGTTLTSNGPGRNPVADDSATVDESTLEDESMALDNSFGGGEPSVRARELSSDKRSDRMEVDGGADDSRVVVENPLDKLATSNKDSTAFDAGDVTMEVDAGALDEAVYGDAGGGGEDAELEYPDDADIPVVRKTKEAKKPATKRALAKKRKKIERFTPDGERVPDLPKGMIKDLFTHFLGPSVKMEKDVVDSVIDASHEFFQQFMGDATAYSQHAGRKNRVVEADVIAMMRRQRLLTPKMSLTSLSRKMGMPRELQIVVDSIVADDESKVRRKSKNRAKQKEARDQKRGKTREVEEEEGEEELDDAFEGEGGEEEDEVEVDVGDSGSDS